MADLAMSVTLRCLFLLVFLLWRCQLVLAEMVYERIIRFPSTPGNYPANHSQTWKFTVESPIHLTANVTDLAMEDSLGCKADYLRIFNHVHQHNPWVFCGQASSFPRSLNFSTQTYGVTVQFHSDKSVQDRGFAVQLSGIAIDEADICDMMKNQPENQISSKILDNADKYPGHLNCSWFLEAPSGYQMVLEFREFDLEYSGLDCLWDRIEVWATDMAHLYPMELLGTFCGRRVPWTMYTYSTAVMIRFITDENNNGRGFLMRHSWVSILRKRRRTKIVTATSDCTVLKRCVLSIKDSFVEYIIRTHPGFRILVNSDNPQAQHWQYLEGPFSYSDRVRLEPTGGAISEGFFVFIKMVRFPTEDTGCSFTFFIQSFDTFMVGSPYHQILDFNSVWDTVSRIIEEWGGHYWFIPDFFPKTLHVDYFKIVMPPNEHPQLTTEFISERMKTIPNTDNCAYGGIALYDGQMSFNDIIGPFCEFTPGYTAGLLRKLIASTSTLYVVIYDYSKKQKKSIDMNKLKVGSSACRGYQVTELMFQNGKTIRDDPLLLKVKRNTTLRSVEVTYEQSSADCFVIQFLPFESGWTDIELSLAGTFAVRICRQWGFRSAQVMKYDGVENCTLYDVGGKKTNRLVKRLHVHAKSDWTIEYIRLELGDVSENICPVVFCSERRGTPLNLRCGYIYGSFPKGCVVTLWGPDNHDFTHTYAWEVRISNIKPNVEFLPAILQIEQVFHNDVALYITNITSNEIKPGNAFQLRSLQGKALRVTGYNVKDIAVKFRRRLTEPLFQEPNSTVNGSRCFVHTGRCYLLVIHEHPTSWMTARENCEKEGGHLLTIKSFEELEIMEQFIKFGQRKFIFIGLSDISKAGDYQWLDGCPLSFSDWYYPFAESESYHAKDAFQLDIGKLQPIKDTSQRCVAMTMHGFRSTNWRKIPCEISYTNVSSICEVRIAETTAQVSGQSQETHQSPQLLRCNPGWIFVKGQCLILLSDKYIVSEDVTGSQHTNMSIQLCSGYKLTMAQVANIPDETLFYFLISSGLRQGEDEVHVSVSISNSTSGCVSLKKKRNANLVKIPLGRESKTCVQSLSEKIHAICESDPVPIVQECEPLQFPCRDGTCLNPDRVCDNFPDCLQGEDEAKCAARSYTFRCGDGEEISIFRYCDFHADCADGSDESSCSHSNCSRDEFTCDSGQCIPQEFKCDLIHDCFDESDEEFCDSNQCLNLAKCRIYGCIPNIQKNDLQPDCPDGTQSDELGKYQHSNWKFRFVSDANSDRQFMTMGGTGEPLKRQKCHENHPRLYHRSRTCIYDHDAYGKLRYCRNGAHLQHCKEHECPDMFKCPGSYCIPPHKLCDGVPDCTSGEDESRCENRTCPYQLRCGRTNQCVSKPYVCDGQVHCKSGYDDERFCDVRLAVCPFNCKCFGYSLKCTNNYLSNIPIVAETTRVLDLSNNSLNLNDSSGIFDNLQYLSFLYLQQNAIRRLYPEMFAASKNLLLLDLSENNIDSIPRGTFSGLANLLTLLLHGNPIKHITEGGFVGLSALPTLTLNNMFLTELGNSTFTGLNELISLELSNNNIGYMDSGAILPARRLELLNLKGNHLNRTSVDTFAILHVKKLQTDFYAICCHVSSTVTDCSPPLDSYKSCSDLLSSTSVRVIVWIFALLTLVGNGGTIFWRLKTKLQTVPSILVFNLSISDFLMGIYLLNLAVADLQYKGNYALYDDEWRRSGQCLAIGAIATISCEMSTFTLVGIALDRTIALAFTFSSSRFTRKGTTITLIVGWTVCMLVCLSPFLFPSYFGSYYSRNSVCVPFNFSEVRENGWEFSFFLFVVLNIVSVTLIIIMYVFTYFRVKKVQQNAGRKDRLDLDMARKLTIVIMTDVICVIPLTVTNLMGTFENPINRDLAAVLTAVILPVNSALNPYLFTFSNLQSR